MPLSYMCQPVKPSAGITLCLTIAGVIPIWFVALSASIFFHNFAVLGLFYAAILLAFFGGSNWALAILHNHLWAYAWSIVPAIAAWILITGVIYSWFSSQMAWLIIGVTYLIQLLVDIRLARSDEMPSWFSAIRALGTAIMLLAVAIIVIRLGINGSTLSLQ